MFMISEMGSNQDLKLLISTNYTKYSYKDDFNI